MISVISPAKSLDFTPADATVPITRPVFKADAATLAGVARKLSRSRLKAMMALSDDLADLNYLRFQEFAAKPAAEAVKQAGLSFAGDTYTGLEFATLDTSRMTYAQDHLRILSGLYGLLRPLDAIQPYRLEMGRRLKTRKGETLYDYWEDRLASALDAQATATGSSAIVNLASTEYFRAARESRLRTPVITPVFYDEKSGKPKVISFFAKRARGAMARFMIENEVTTLDALTGFDRNGYCFMPAQSTPSRPVFLRSEAMQKAS